MVDLVALDPGKVHVGRHPDRGVRLLDDADHVDVVALLRDCLLADDRVDAGLEDINHDPAGEAGLGRGVFPHGPDVHDDPGEVGVGEVAEVIDLGRRVLGRSRDSKSRECDDGEREFPQSIPIISNFS
jgi:hypothetical protein